MGPVLQGLAGISLLVAIVCFVLVVIKMFQNNQTVLGIVSIVAFCCGVGLLVGLVVGWMNAANWHIQKLMYVYTGAVLVYIIFAVIGLSTGSITIPHQP
jgi:hypothetical protein